MNTKGLILVHFVLKDMISHFLKNMILFIISLCDQTHLSNCNLLIDYLLIYTAWDTNLSIQDNLTILVTFSQYWQINFNCNNWMIFIGFFKIIWIINTNNWFSLFSTFANFIFRLFAFCNFTFSCYASSLKCTFAIVRVTHFFCWKAFWLYVLRIMDTISSPYLTNRFYNK
jgi:hypothetical protein